MTSGDAPVVLTNVTKRFGSTTAVRSVSWTPRCGEVTALVGLNGAGKSTLLRMASGLVGPTEGSVTLTTEAARPLSAMIEAPALFNGVTVWRNLAIHRVLTGTDASDAVAVAELTRVDQVLRRRVGSLSQGYRQRVAIAQALLGSPRVLLLDEPSTALDPEAVAHLRAVVRAVADRGVAVVVSTHQLRELEGVADALLLLHDGRVCYDGPFASFVGPPALWVRAVGSDAHSRLGEALRAEQIELEQHTDGLRVATGAVVDDTAHLIVAAAAEADVDLVELAHLTPTLEDAFHAAIAGARA